MKSSNSRNGLSLVEVMLASIVLAVVAVTVLNFTRLPGERVKQQACELRVEQLRVLSQQYLNDYGRYPSRRMRELAAERYVGDDIPVCPVDGRPYRGVQSR